MASAAQSSGHLVLQDNASSKLGRFVGLSFAAIFPACVWTVVVSNVSYVIGVELEAVALCFFGLAVALCMVTAFAPVMLRD